MVPGGYSWEFMVGVQKPYSNNTDTEGTMESVRIKRVEYRENVRVFFPQG